jgi:transposase
VDRTIEQGDEEGHIQGLVYLLSLALRVLILVEWVARERLRQEQARLQGIYASQPGRKTDRPSAELLLGVLKTISISVIEVNGRIHTLLSPLTEVQKCLMELWDLPSDFYEKVASEFSQPP